MLRTIGYTVLAALSCALLLAARSAHAGDAILIVKLMAAIVVGIATVLVVDLAGDTQARALVVARRRSGAAPRHHVYVAQRRRMEI